jgi:hypothetical protein
MAAMDSLMPGIRTGNFAPCRAGGFAGNHLIHSSFMPAKSVSSRRMTVTLTTRSREVPAALRMADTFSKHFLVCSWIVSPIIFPVTGSCGPVPETNTRPAARTAWLHVGGGDGAPGVRMMSLAPIKNRALSAFIMRLAIIVVAGSWLPKANERGGRLTPTFHFLCAGNRSRRRHAAEASHPLVDDST